MNTPFLTESELAELTMPLTRPTARRRYLDRLGVPYTVRPDGQPIVGREVIARRLGAGAVDPQSAAPNVQALLDRIGKGRRAA